MTIPKAVRHLLGIVPGSKVALRYEADGKVVITRADGEIPESRFAKWRGHARPGMTTDKVMALTRADD